MKCPLPARDRGGLVSETLSEASQTGAAKFRTKKVETHSDWNQLVEVLREELQEKGGLMQLLNQQTEVLYLLLPDENRRLEEQIRKQLLETSRCTQKRQRTLRELAARMNLPDGAGPKEMVVRFPEYVQPLLEALFSEVDRLSGRMEERLRQNQQLKTRFFSEATSMA